MELFELSSIITFVLIGIFIMNEHHLIEQELKICLKACAAGDHSAFKNIYNHTSAKLNAIILNMVRDQDLANDILQKSYLSIWQNASRYDPEKGKAFTWMLVITRNRAIDVIRSRRRVSSTELLCETLEDEHAQTDKEAKRFMLRRYIEPHMKNLPPNMASAITLNVVQGMTSKEVGEKLGVPTNTAKSWIRRGLQNLRKKMDIKTVDKLL